MWLPLCSATIEEQRLNKVRCEVVLVDLPARAMSKIQQNYPQIFLLAGSNASPSRINAAPSAITTTSFAFLERRWNYLTHSHNHRTLPQQDEFRCVIDNAMASFLLRPVEFSWLHV